MMIRNEKTDDYRAVEEMIKKTFWNLSVPGCREHYFAHLIRESEDFIPELDFVLEEDGKIIGHIMYVKAKLAAMDGTEKEILSFGPFTIHPDYQGKGYGRKLHHDYLAGGPLEYMAAIFRKMSDSDEMAMQLALEFYGPMYLLYSVYDGAEDKESIAPMLDTHINRFIAKAESIYRKDGNAT